ncbi:MAG: AsmA family protein [Sphingomonadales bacterium]|nr:AsmA family protein [Sphingomonadales bacterium]MDE2170265.1 AsmA family protein [Sphingomonadales bacterium]
MKNRCAGGVVDQLATTHADKKGWARGATRLMSGAILLLILALLGLAAFPWGLLKSRIEAHMTGAIGRPVMIGSMERLDSFSFHPLIRLTRLRIPQPAWVRPGLGDLARVERIDMRLSAWSLLTGKVSVEQVDATGASLQLYRNRDGRRNWTNGRGHSSGGPTLGQLRVANSHLRYVDEKRDRSFDLAVAADDTGLRLDGQGLIMGHGVTVQACGGAVNARRGPWPFSLTLDGKAVGLAMTGTMAAPLDLDHLRAAVKGHAQDLRLLDALIEAGLPGTQAVSLTAQVSRAGPDWTIETLAGTIGRSDIEGHAVIIKRHGRTRITGALSADHFDFGDLSSNEGKARAAAMRARTGPRLLPASAIDLTHVRHTDGSLDLRVAHLLWPGPSPFRSLHAHLSLERSQLRLDPLTVGMHHGVFAGTMVIDQHTPGQKDPKLTLSMTMQGARLLDVFPRAHIDGGLRGRMMVSGYGHRLRDAFGRGNGVIALVGHDGLIPARTASLLGQDAGRGITTGKQELASLRCVVMRLDLHSGVARAAPIVIDTSRALTTVSGSIRLSDERLFLTLKGAPKQASVLRLPGQIEVNGTIKAPDIRVPAHDRSLGGAIAMVVKGITGHQAPLAHDADCDRLARRAMR